MDDELPKILKKVAHSDKRVFFELDNHMYASASMEEGDTKVILFPWKDIFLQYLYEDIPEPDESAVKTAEENYYRYGKDARLLIVD